VPRKRTNKDLVDWGQGVANALARLGGGSSPSPKSASYKGPKTDPRFNKRYAGLSSGSQSRNRSRQRRAG